jgi:hypothetical protein
VLAIQHGSVEAFWRVERRPLRVTRCHSERSEAQSRNL